MKNNKGILDASAAPQSQGTFLPQLLSSSRIASQADPISFLSPAHTDKYNALRPQVTGFPMQQQQPQQTGFMQPQQQQGFMQPQQTGAFLSPSYLYPCLSAFPSLTSSHFGSFRASSDPGFPMMGMPVQQQPQQFMQPQQTGFMPQQQTGYNPYGQQQQQQQQQTGYRGF